MYATRGIINASKTIFVGLIVFIHVSLFIGCGPTEPPSGSISGKVTYKGKPLTLGVVTLINEQTGIGASVNIDASGGYYIKSIRTGEYKVAVHHSAPPPGQKLVKLNIPEKYQNIQTSGLTVKIEEGENMSDFKL